MSGIVGHRGMLLNADGAPSSLVFDMEFEGANGSTTFTDNFGKTIVRTGNPTISTAQFSTGTSSGLFPGGDDYLDVSAASTDFDFGTGDFAIDVDVRPATVSGIHMFVTTRAAVGSDPGFLFWQTGTQIRFLAWGPAAGTTLVDITGGALALNTWSRARIQRVGTGFTLSQDGSSIGTATSSGAIAAPGNALRIGRDPTTGARNYNGYMDRLKIFKGGIS